jgi:hypothetical protein
METLSCDVVGIAKPNAWAVDCQLQLLFPDNPTTPSFARKTYLQFPFALAFAF